MIIKLRNVSVNVNESISMFQRRMQKAENKIKDILKEINVNMDEMEISEDIHPLAEKQAYVWWYVDNEHCHLSCSKMKRYFQNLEVVQKVLEKEVSKVVSGEESIQEFVARFKEIENVKKLRKKAREFFSLSEDCKDLSEINKRYKQLSKKLHPDTDSGDEEKFKELNEMHKVLKRELE